MICGREVRCIGSNAYSNQDTITNITIPTTITEIGNNAFGGLSNILDITFETGSKLQTIGSSAFENCTSLSSANIPTSVISIGSSAFENCSNLNSLTILNIQTIGAKAFKGCALLTNVNFPTSLLTIGDGAFAGCNNLNITVSSSNPNFTAQGNILYNKTKTKIIASGKVASNVTIPSTVTEIAPYAFDGNSNLTILKIENNPTIGMYAFANCANMTKAYFNSYIVPTIGVNSFINNNFTLYVPHSKQQIYNSAFVGYTNSIASIGVDITFVSEGKNVGAKSTYYGATILDLMTPSKEGYDFSGWYDNPNFTGAAYENWGLWDTTEDITLYAKWTPKKYYIIFDGTGSENLEDKEVTYGMPIGDLPIIEIDGKIFSDWKNSEGVLFTKDTIWTDLYNATLTYDVFSVSYIVTLDKKGGDGGSDRVDARYSSPMPSGTAPSKDNYIFQGYFLEENGSVTKYYNSDMTSAKNWEFEKAKTLVAHWIGNPYTVTLDNQYTERFNTNLTSTSSSNINYISFIANSSGTITLYTSHTSGDPYLILYDKNLKILSSNDDGYGNSDSKITYNIMSGNRYVVGFRAYSSTTTVGQVRYSGVSISYSNIFAEVEVTFGSIMPTIGIPTPTKAGYTFIQYNTDSGGQGTSYYYGSNIASDSTWDRPEDTKLYAIWEKTQYTLSFVLGGGLDYSVPLFNGDTIIADELYWRSHLDFKGYYDGLNGTGTNYVGVKLETWGLYTSPVPDNLGITWNKNANLTLYAHWVPMVMNYSYRIDVAGGGSLPAGTIYIESGKETTLNAPAIEGYTFEYWDANGHEYTNGSKYTFNLHHSYNTGKITIYDPSNGVSPLGADGDLSASYTKNPECVARGTLITLADGSQKAVELLTGNEMLLVWNLKTGQFDTAPILFIDSDAASMFKIINLYFSDGTHVKVIDEHAFWDFNLNRYVFLREDAAQYIGHSFNKQITDASGDFTWTKVQLVNVVIAEEFTTAWSPITFGHLCIYVNGMLSMPGATTGLINIFDVDGETMTIDQEQFLMDIETYGLFTYEEFADIFPVSENIFKAFDAQYLKISIGKGLIDYDTLGMLIARYSEFLQAEDNETGESNNSCIDYSSSN